MHILAVTLFTDRSLEEMRRYYAGVLGLPVLDVHDQSITFQAGRTRLQFRSLDPLSAEHPRYHFAFDVPSQRFATAVRWLRDRSEPIVDLTGTDQFHSPSWNSDSVYFRDAQGNILELVARHDLPSAGRLAAETPFSSAEIIAITEVGLAVERVAETVADLMRAMPGLDVFRNSPSDTFMPLGDNHGLLIVVRNGRIWFPETGVPAAPVPLELLLEVGTPPVQVRLNAPPFPYLLMPV